MVTSDKTICYNNNNVCPPQVKSASLMDGYIENLLQVTKGLHVSIDDLSVKLLPVLDSESNAKDEECCDRIRYECELIKIIGEQIIVIDYAIRRISELRNRCCL